MDRIFTIEELKAAAGHRGVRIDNGAGRVAVWNRRTEVWDWYAPMPDGREGYRLSGSTEALGRATTRYPTAAGAAAGNAERTARRIAERDKAAILAPDEGGRLVRRAPLKPVPVEQDADQEGAPEVTCPRCKGYGGVFPADEGESCNLCDGHGMVFDHGDGTYSNRTDKARYYW